MIIKNTIYLSLSKIINLIISLFLIKIILSEIGEYPYGVYLVLTNLMFFFDYLIILLQLLALDFST